MGKPKYFVVQWGLNSFLKLNLMRKCWIYTKYHSIQLVAHWSWALRNTSQSTNTHKHTMWDGWYVNKKCFFIVIITHI